MCRGGAWAELAAGVTSMAGIQSRMPGFLFAMETGAGRGACRRKLYSETGHAPAFRPDRRGFVIGRHYARYFEK